VVSVEQAVAAPFATRQLADLGARVIKVERPGAGDFARNYDASVKGLASYFVWLNRGKQSLSLDLKTSAGLAILTSLIDRADVFVQNLAPGAAARMGLSAATLRSRDERLIVCDVSGYAPGGPMGHRRAYDLLIQCETGVLAVTGTPDAPAKAGISIADIAGGMYAFSSVLAALYARERTGIGAALQVSLFEALTEWMSQPMYYAMYTGTPPARTGTSHATIAPYGAFRTGGGGSVQLAVQNDREWRRLCDQVLGRPAGLTPRRSRTASSTRSATCWSIRSLSTGGPRWTPPPGRCGRCPLRSVPAVRHPRSGRSRPWASTPMRSWLSSASPPRRSPRCVPPGRYDPKGRCRTIAQRGQWR
jgi:itaconate CoA-transferase